MLEAWMRKRSLSEFMGSEMLYDYKSGRLDSHRTMAVEEVLESSPKVRKELKTLTAGIEYCEKLKAINVSDQLTDFIVNQPTIVEKIISALRWSRLPQPVRWAFEAVVVAVAIALFVVQMPELFKDQQVKSDSVIVKKFDLTPPTETVPESAPEPVATIPVPEPAPTPLPAPEAIAPPVVVSPPPIEKPIEKKGNAYVYRMTMFVDDVDKVTPEVVALIESLGGSKAGEVELGWRRKGGSYFHFSIPMATTTALQEGLKKYAPFNMIKSNHPRVMPADTERFILWMEKRGGEAEVESAEASAAESEEESGVQQTEEESQESTEGVETEEDQGN
jgi:hypothetical protein